MVMSRVSKGMDGCPLTVEATCITNENLAKLFQMLSTMEAKIIAPTPPVLALTIPPVITIPSASQPSRIRPSTLNDFDRDQLKSCVLDLL
jgi:hypothetical protein